MDEILRELPAGSFVLDLGSSQGSFACSATLATVVRFDREAPRSKSNEWVVLGDAAQLPFADGVFRAVVANHSLEHFDRLEPALAEAGRVIDRRGAFFVSVPDASTLTDKLYRWLARGGGHVNAFVTPGEVIDLVERITGLPQVATRTLYSSLSFLNRRQLHGSWPRRRFLVGGGSEWSLLLYTWGSRRIDRWLGTRSGIYGWAFYFGAIAETVSTVASANVCIRCGSGSPADTLRVRSRFWLFQSYNCPGCGATNAFTGG